MKEEKYTCCFCCDSLCLKKRIESHHIYGKELEQTIPVCILCHDFLDRLTLDDSDVFIEIWANLSKEMKELPKKEFRYIKIILLKAIKNLSISTRETDKFNNKKV